MACATTGKSRTKLVLTSNVTFKLQKEKTLFLISHIVALSSTSLLAKKSQQHGSVLCFRRRFACWFRIYISWRAKKHVLANASGRCALSVGGEGQHSLAWQTKSRVKCRNKRQPNAKTTDHCKTSAKQVSREGIDLFLKPLLWRFGYSSRLTTLVIFDVITDT